MRASVFAEAEQEAHRFMWIESEKAGYDLGEAAIHRWVLSHWWGFLRTRWLEHLQGQRFWVELDRGDFGLLQREFRDDALLLDRVLDRLKGGQQNLDILLWASEWGIPMDRLVRILEALDINSRRLAHRFDQPGFPEAMPCSDLSRMLDLLGDGASPRRLRLLAAACCRRVWHLLGDVRSRAAVEVAEAQADGLAGFGLE